MEPAQEKNKSSLFSRVKPGDKPPPPPPQLALWTAQTSNAVLFGMLYGGYLGLVEARSARGSLDQPPSQSGNPSSGNITSHIKFQNRYHRAAAYFVHGGILHGAKIGSFVGMVSGLSLAFSAMRNEQSATLQDPLSLAAASGITCGVFTGVYANAVNTAKAFVFGSAAGGFAGAVHSYLASHRSSLDLHQDPYLDTIVGNRPEPEPEKLTVTVEGALEAVSLIEQSQRERDVWIRKANLQSKNSSTSNTS